MGVAFIDREHLWSLGTDGRQGCQRQDERGMPRHPQGLLSFRRSDHVRGPLRLLPTGVTPRGSEVSDYFDTHEIQVPTP